MDCTCVQLLLESSRPPAGTCVTSSSCEMNASKTDGLPSYIGCPRPSGVSWILRARPISRPLGLGPASESVSPRRGRGGGEQLLTALAARRGHGGDLAGPARAEVGDADAVELLGELDLLGDALRSRAVREVTCAGRLTHRVIGVDGERAACPGDLGHDSVRGMVQQQWRASHPVVLADVRHLEVLVRGVHNVGLGAHGRAAVKHASVQEARLAEV
jgi:hypothetical protein